MKNRDVLPCDNLIELGQAWAGSSVNCVPFRCSAIASRGNLRATAYYDQDGNVAVIRSVDGEWSQSERWIIPCARKPFDAHQCISLIVDRDNNIHLAYGAHASSMFYTRIENLHRGSHVIEPEVWGKDGSHRYTYPMFLDDPVTGEPLLLFRSGVSSRAEIRIKRWNSSTKKYRDDRAALISGRGGPRPSGPYLNTPAISRDGKITLFYVWRLPAEATDRGAVVNVGLDGICSLDGLRTVAMSNGVTISRPVVPVTSERVVSVPAGANLINQGAGAVRADGAPMALTYWNDQDGIAQYKLVWEEGGRWHVRNASKFTTRFQLDGVGTLPLPHSRPELLMTENGTALCIFRSQEFKNRLVLRSLNPPNYGLKGSRTIVLVDQDLGFYEPVVDRATWHTEGTLSIYVQRCQQTIGDYEKTVISTPAFLVEWKRDTVGRLVSERN